MGKEPYWKTTVRITGCKAGTLVIMGSKNDAMVGCNFSIRSIEIGLSEADIAVVGVSFVVGSVAVALGASDAAGR